MIHVSQLSERINIFKKLNGLFDLYINEQIYARKQM